MPEISRDGVRIHFDDVGSGPPVVLGHSLLCSGEMWGPQVPVIAEKFRVINVDQRGHGRGAVRAVDVEPQIMLGADIGQLIERIDRRPR